MTVLATVISASPADRDPVGAGFKAFATALGSRRPRRRRRAGLLRRPPLRPDRESPR